MAVKIRSRAVSGLALKITLPFVALFALILLVLGLVLAREIMSEVEAQVEREQRFVLEAASWATFAFDEDKLREIRDLASQSPAKPVSHLVVLQEGARTLTTFARSNTEAIRTLQAFEDLVKNRADLRLREEAISRYDINLNGQRWLALHRMRPMPLQARHFYLLYPYIEIEQAKNQVLLRIVTLGGVGLILAAALGLAIAHWISRPVRRLAAAAKRISAGGLNESLEGLPVSKHSDEIAELTLAFKSMMESLRVSQNELLKTERLAVTGKLAAGMAHEIRNPLTSLRMTVEMLQQRTGNADEVTQEAYRVLLSEIDRLALAVEELLTFARPRPPQRAPLDVNQLVTDTLKFLERQMSHAHVQSVIELDQNLPASIALDHNKIRQLLVNLILNAQHAIIRDGIVTVTTAWDEPKQVVKISVKDTGPGISEEVRGKLFELFVTTKPDGGGFGLAIVKQIVEEHGGDINFKTSPQGTTFTIALPAEEILR
ncbi:MAG: ATP-binding protein [Planctomycetota bacterium]